MYMQRVSKHEINLFQIDVNNEYYYIPIFKVLLFMFFIGGEPIT